MSAEPQGGLTSAPKVAWWQVLSWQMYDFADTIYSMNVYSNYFALFVVDVLHRDASEYGLILTFANLLVAVASPLLGAISDVSQRRMPFLRVFAILTAITTALIALAPSYAVAVLFFILSYLFYQMAWNFYQALLPGLCNEQNVSRVSGIAIALGYVGSIFGVVSMIPLVKGPQDYYLVFPVSAALYMLFAIPGITFVPDFAPATRKITLDIKNAYRRVADTLTHARLYPGLFRFLVADFIYENAVAAVIAFMTVYATKVFGLSGLPLQLFLIFCTAFAVIAGFLFGPIVDRIGPKKAVVITLVIWLITLGLVAVVKSSNFFLALGPLAGIGLAAVWTSSRTYLVALAPVEKSGEFFGLYALSGKSASVVGVGVWTLVLKFLTEPFGEVFALRSAVWAMWLFVLIGLFLVRSLPDVRPTRANILDRSKAEA